MELCLFSLTAATLSYILLQATFLIPHRLQNATLEEENRNLRRQLMDVQTTLQQSEAHSSQLNSDLCATRGQHVALRGQLEKCEAECTATATHNALLQSQNLALQKDLEQVESRMSRLLDEHKDMMAAKVDIDHELADVRRACGLLTSEQSALKSKYNTLKKNHSSTEVEFIRLKEQHQGALKEIAVLTEWKETREHISEVSMTADAESSSKLSAEYAQARTDIVRLESERNRAKQDYDDLMIDYKVLKNELNRWKQRHEEQMATLSMWRERSNAIDVDNNKLISRCEVINCNVNEM